MKVINLPTKKVNYSKKLENALRYFYNETGSQYYDEERENGIYYNYFRINEDICVQQKVIIKQEDYVCYTILSINAYNENINKFYSLINRLNSQIDYGNFEVDSKNNEIRFRTYYEPGDIIYMESIDKMLGYPLYVIEKYAEEILSCLR